MNTIRPHEYVAAARRIIACLTREDGVYETRLDAGECVIFNNRRLVHVRAAFEDEPEQERRVRGCYVDGDRLRSMG